MTTPFVATHPASVNPLVKKTLSASDAARTGQEPDATGFDELLAREMSDALEASAVPGMKKGQDRVLRDMPEVTNAEIPDAAVKSTKDGRITEKSSKEDPDSKIDVLVQQFMQAANPAGELTERQRAFSATGRGEATGLAFEGEGWTGKNKEPEFQNGEHGHEVEGADVVVFGAGGVMPSERAQSPVNFRSVVQEAGIRPESNAALAPAGRELLLGIPSGPPEATAGVSPDVAQQAGSARPGIAADSVGVTDTRIRSDANTLQSGTAQGSERRVEFPPELASRGYVDKHVERPDESVSVIGTQYSLATYGGAMLSPDGSSSMTLQTVAPVDNSLLLHPRIDSSGWGDALSQKVLWMVTQQQQTAELSLNPPDLGPLQVVLSVDNDQASAMFVSQNADVRQALEAALPRLKEMMAESGINLGSTTVTAEGSHQNDWQDRSGNGSSSGNPESDESVMGTSITSVGPGRLIGGRGLVDTFA